MERVHQFLIGGALAGVALLLLRSTRTDDDKDAGGELAPIRVAALQAVSEVVPSAYGSQKFARLAPGYTPAILERFPTFTTCGYLPSFVARHLGGTGRILQAGLELMRTEARDKGAWRTLADGLPRPGDFYGLANTKDGILVHVGVVKAATNQEWLTADAGQGPRNAQRAEFLRRDFRPADGSVQAGAGRKLLAGWLDLEAYPVEAGRLMTVAVEPWRVEPPHEKLNEAKLERLERDMRQHGWRGRPLLLEPLDDGTTRWQAWTGSHRLAAALRAGVPIQAVSIDLARFLPHFAGQLAPGETLFSRTTSDQQRLQALEEVGDYQAAQLVRAEIRANRHDPKEAP